MRKIRVQVVSILLLLAMLLTGCSSGVKNYIHTDAGLKNEAEKALEEKYGEEFVIHEVWTMSQTMFYATCSPEDEQDIVFEAQVYKDGRGVYRDKYIQGAVERQLEKEIQSKVEKTFGESFVEIEFTLVGEYYDYYEEVSIEEYYELYGDVYPYIRIFVNIENRDCEEELLLEEFECLSQLYDMELIEGAGCRCYFVDDDSLNMCRNYFDMDTDVGSDFFDTLKYFGFGFNNGAINKTFDDYKKVRKEINTNEQ